VKAREDSIPPHVRAAISAAQEKQAADVILLDLDGLGAFTDYFVVCTGFSSRQLDAICDEIDRACVHRTRAPFLRS
jgi:ribosome-associated protein